MRSTANEILAITNVGDVFSNDINIIKKEYQKLAKEWHPDFNGNSLESNTVMTKINLLYEKALILIGENKWEGTNFIKIPCVNNKSYEIKYKVSYNFELGNMYVNDNIVVYIVDGKHKDFYKNGISKIKNFKFVNDKMKEEMQRFLPIINEEFETIDSQYGVILKKTPDLLLLKDVLQYYNNNIPDKHVAWILSSLYNIACYIDYSNLAHNGITLSNYFISPKYHSGALLGGWWYAKEH
jgi:hypothetical protein